MVIWDLLCGQKGTSKGTEDFDPFLREMTVIWNKKWGFRQVRLWGKRDRVFIWECYEFSGMCGHIAKFRYPYKCIQAAVYHLKYILEEFVLRHFRSWPLFSPEPQASVLTLWPLDQQVFNWFYFIFWRKVRETTYQGVISVQSINSAVAQVQFHH